MIQHQWLSYWLNTAGHHVPSSDPAALRRCLEGLGLRTRAFKLYAEYGDQLFRPLGPLWLRQHEPVVSLRNALEYLHLLQKCEVDIAPPPILVAALARCQLRGESIAALPVQIFRGAWRALTQAVYLGQSAVTFVEREFIPALCWLFENELDRNLDNNRGKAGWSWLHDRWAAERRRRALPASRREWLSPVNDVTISSYRFIALLSHGALKDEGEIMRHCIASYGEACQAGYFQVFSVRELATLDRVATLALAGDRGRWVIIGLKAAGNAEPAPEVSRAVTQFVQDLSPYDPPDSIPRQTLDRVAARIAAMNA